MPPTVMDYGESISNVTNDIAAGNIPQSPDFYLLRRGRDGCGMLIVLGEKADCEWTVGCTRLNLEGS